MIALDTAQANKEITLFIVVGNVNLWVKPEPYKKVLFFEKGYLLRT